MSTMQTNPLSDKQQQSDLDADYEANVKSNMQTNPLGATGGGGHGRRGRKVSIVFSYKTIDENKDKVVSTTCDELEKTYGHEVYFELRNMKPGLSFEDQVRCT